MKMTIVLKIKTNKGRTFVLKRMREVAFLVCYKRFYSLLKQAATYSQRHALFHICCTINEKVCNVIIDNGSCENIVSQKLVTTLNLKVDLHPNPYKISWIMKGGEAQIQSTCTVPLSIRNHYKDQVTWLDMDV